MVEKGGEAEAGGYCAITWDERLCAVLVDCERDEETSPR